MIQFTCGRCGKTHIEPASLQARKNLHEWEPPEGWVGPGHYTPLLCDECYKALMIFMKGDE